MLSRPYLRELQIEYTLEYLPYEYTLEYLPYRNSKLWSTVVSLEM